MQWIPLRAKLSYDPVRPDFKKSYKTRTLIAELPRDGLDTYYHWMLKAKYGTWLQLQRPMYGLHVTVVKGTEQVPLKMLNLNWKKHQGKMVALEYSPELYRHWQFWSLPVRSLDLENLRTELGLSSKFNFHITVGRQLDWMPT